MPFDESIAHFGCPGCPRPDCPRRSDYESSQRRTRSQTKVTEFVNLTTSVEPEGNDYYDNAFARPEQCKIEVIPQKLTIKNTELSEDELEILHKHQKWLSRYRPSIPDDSSEIAAAANATLIFPRWEAGTAVCISPAGLLLTCAHCISERPDDLHKTFWLLFASGQAVQAKYIMSDTYGDLALLRIVAAQQNSDPTPTPCFPSVNVADKAPKAGSKLVCIGQPGAEDLEASTPGLKTNYDIVHVSEGKFRGYASGQNLRDNSEIGALMHDCWTYWGHSGAPLINPATGELVGLHSSWDDETGMRRGIALEAIQEHLKTNFDAVEYYERKNWMESWFGDS
jgi:S1-C subfamily serine protease